MNISIHVISLPNDEESRKRRIRLGQLEHADRFAWFDAVDGRTADPALVERFMARDHQLRPGQIGCALSHLLLWESQAEVPRTDDDIMLVLEDDAVYGQGLLAHIEQIASALRTLNKPWDLMYLGHTAEKAAELVINVQEKGIKVHDSYHPRGCFGYAISSQGLQNILGWSGQVKLKLPIDEEIMLGIWRGKIKSVSIHPMLVTTVGGISTISERLAS